MFMDQNKAEVNEHAKKERGQYPVVLTEPAWSLKELLYGIKNQKIIFYLVGKIAPSCLLR